MNKWTNPNQNSPLKSVESIDFLHPTIPEEVHNSPEEQVEYYSQLNPLWKNKLIPNASQNFITIGNYGCLLACIATLFQIPPDILAYSNKDCFQNDGNMLTDKLLSKLGSTQGKLKKPIKGQTYICRTSFYSPKYPTHFYIQLSDGKIIDPNNPHPHPNEVNKYANTTNEWRLLTNTKLK